MRMHASHKGRLFILSLTIVAKHSCNSCVFIPYWFNCSALFTNYIFMKKNLLCFFLCAAVSFLFAGKNPQSIKTIRTTSAPVIDGYGNDDSWKQANIATDFIQRDPYEGQPATEKTEFKIVVDDNNIYFYAMMYDSSPDSIVARLARRDGNTESDFIAIGFDSYNDKQTGYVFFVYASGTRGDILLYNDGNNEDNSWDPVWEVKTQMLPNGWSAEMKIPLSQLRFNEGNDTWGFEVVRKISRKQEETHWALVKKSENGFVSLWGTMTGMSEVKLPPLFEVLPYTVGSSEHYPASSRREKIERIRPNIGADIKYGLSSNVTLDVTVNPDFGQVEADPALLNLTTFETLYPEKRPFFIEGTQIFRFNTFGGQFGPGLFYSRRIGKAVRASLPKDGKIITDEPFHATILTAAKLTGKTDQGTSIGILTALTDEEEFSYRDTIGSIKTLRAEPRATYNLFRIKQDFWGNSNVGVIFTGVARDNRYPAYTAGTDWNIKFDDNTYQLDGFVAGSRTVQIPQLTDEVREGSAGRVQFGKVSGDWIWGGSSDFTSKKYFVNDIGFFRAPNDYGFFGNLIHRDFQPGEYFRSITYGFFSHIRWNFDGATLFKELSVQTWGQFLNYWNFNASVSISLPSNDAFESRGNGIFNVPASYFIRGEIETDNRKELVFGLEENIRTVENGTRSFNTEGSVTYRPVTSMEYRLSSGYSAERGRPSYADTVTDMRTTTKVAVFGKRNVDFLDVTLRSSILFSNDLSLQIYNQFFWAKGEYQQEKFSVLNPSGNLTEYSYNGNKDFNRTSLISNVVLRWEYREGSTFYFVWSHGRAFEQTGGYNTSLGTNIDNTFLAKPDNVYVVKVSYWHSL